MRLDKEVVMNVLLTYCMDKLNLNEITLSLEEMLEITEKHDGEALRVDVINDNKTYRVKIEKNC